MIVLFTLDIVLRIRPAPIDQLSTSACRQLVKAAKLIKRDVRRQIRYAMALTTALDTLPGRHTLTPVCAMIARWPISDDDRWQSAIHGLYKALAEGDDSMRLAMWWSLRDRSQDMHLTSGACYDMIIYLLTPIDPQLPAKAIQDLIHHEILTRWSEEAIDLDVASAETIRQHILALNGLSPGSSTKRKRKNVMDVSQVTRMLHDRLPDICLGEGESISELTLALQK